MHPAKRPLHVKSTSGSTSMSHVPFYHSNCCRDWIFSDRPELYIGCIAANHQCPILCSIALDTSAQRRSTPNCRRFPPMNLATLVLPSVRVTVLLYKRPRRTESWLSGKTCAVQLFPIVVVSTQIEYHCRMSQTPPDWKRSTSPCGTEVSRQAQQGNPR